jgi:hypothetical protein
MHWILAMTAYMGNMPWIILWLSIPWIGSLMTLLGNPNGLYSRRVLGWSIGCFLALSMGLWFANPELFMTDMVVGVSKYNTTRGIIFTGMMFSAIMFLFTWPDGKTAKGLTLLGSALLLMVGMRFGLPQYIYTELQGVLTPNAFGFFVIFTTISAAVLWVLWALSIPYLTKKNTLAFDQAPLFGKLMYFLRWSLLFLPLVVLFTFFDNLTSENLAKFFDNPMTDPLPMVVVFISGISLIYALFSIVVLGAQSWRIPGFWRKVSLMVFWPVFYLVYSRYTCRAPLSGDKTAISNEASPELVHFWNPWTLLNRGMIMAFFTVLLGLGSRNDSMSSYDFTSSEDVKLDLTIVECMYDMGIALIMALHIYALFQPRAVPYRGLLWCSMIYLLGTYCIYGSLFHAIFHAIGWLSLIWTLQTGYRYRAILEQTMPISTPPVLSRFWVLSLLGTSFSVGLYFLYWLSTQSPL